MKLLNENLHSATTTLYHCRKETGDCKSELFHKSKSILESRTSQQDRFSGTKYWPLPLTNIETNHCDPLHPLEHKYEDGNKIRRPKLHRAAWVNCIGQIFSQKPFVKWSHDLSHMQTCSIYQFYWNPFYILLTTNFKIIWQTLLLL